MKFQRTVEVLPGSIKGAITADGVVVMQRQGSGTGLHVDIGGERGFSVQAQYRAKPEISLGKNSTAGARRSDLESLDAMIPQIAALEGIYPEGSTPKRVSDKVLAYIWGRQDYDYQANDIILSPMRYEPSTDTIRHVPTNYCLVAFREGKFADRDLEMDAATKPYRPFVEKALAEGFHDCDFRQGDDYCKRRLAWLAGEYLREDASEKGKVIVLGILDCMMTWPQQYTVL